jgi:hypothetical protein
MPPTQDQRHCRLSLTGSMALLPLPSSASCSSSLASLSSSDSAGGCLYKCRADPLARAASATVCLPMEERPHPPSVEEASVPRLANSVMKIIKNVYKIRGRLTGLVPEHQRLTLLAVPFVVVPGPQECANADPVIVLLCRPAHGLHLPLLGHFAQMALRLAQVQVLLQLLPEMESNMFNSIFKNCIFDFGVLKSRQCWPSRRPKKMKLRQRMHNRQRQASSGKTSTLSQM